MRKFLIEDSIALRLFGNPALTWSPDGRSLVVLTRQGDLEHDCNRYVLTRFDQDGQSLPLLELESSSNRAAIADLIWREDALLFVGEGPGEVRQVHRLNPWTGEHRVLTSLPWGVESFAVAGTRIAATSQAPPEPEVGPVVVGSRSLPEALMGPRFGPLRLFLVEEAQPAREISIPEGYTLHGCDRQLALSPDGSRLLLALDRHRPPESWSVYRDGQMETALRTDVRQLMVCDIASGIFSPTLDAPFHPSGSFSWESDDRILLERTFAPLGDDEAPRPPWRRFELDVASGLTRQLEAPAPAPVRPARVEEGPNRPPRLRIGRRVALDLNPGLARRLSHVERREGYGLFLPRGKGRAAPLVIQTHGWDGARFWPDGPYPCTTGYAAQALSSHGFVVVQLSDGSSQPEGEAEEALARIEGVVDDLVREGLVDAARVGLMGWSRTCYHVKHALVFGRHRYGAALVAEGIDGGLWQYTGWSEQIAPLYETFHGGASPYGAGLDAWRSSCASLHLDRVQTPLLIQVTDRRNLLSEWEWLSGLRRLQRPVELVALDGGAHNLVRPSHRLLSQGMALDWFRFWLTGEEDPAPVKAAQYVRWRGFRRERS